MSKEQDAQDFRVTDKRTFREDGEVQTRPPEAKPDESKSGAFDSEGTKASGREEPSLAETHIDFPSYVLSYYTQGLVLLGEVANPYTSKKEDDLDGARHTIDILTMLEGKTKGNLNSEEEQLLESVLYELRMKYMAKTNRIKL